jgi:hypothetical protein
VREILVKDILGKTGGISPVGERNGELVIDEGEIEIEEEGDLPIDEGEPV